MSVILLIILAGIGSFIGTKFALMTMGKYGQDYIIKEKDERGK